MANPVMIKGAKLFIYTYIKNTNIFISTLEQAMSCLVIDYEFSLIPLQI